MLLWVFRCLHVYCILHDCEWLWRCGLVWRQPRLDRTKNKGPTIRTGKSRFRVRCSGPLTPSISWLRSMDEAPGRLRPYCHLGLEFRIVYRWAWTIGFMHIVLVSGPVPLTRSCNSALPWPITRGWRFGAGRCFLEILTTHYPCGTRRIQYFLITQRPLNAQRCRDSQQKIHARSVVDETKEKGKFWERNDRWKETGGRRGGGRQLHDQKNVYGIENTLLMKFRDVIHRINWSPFLPKAYFLHWLGLVWLGWKINTYLKLWMPSEWCVIG